MHDTILHLEIPECPLADLLPLRRGLYFVDGHFDDADILKRWQGLFRLFATLGDAFPDGQQFCEIPFTIREFTSLVNIAASSRCHIHRTLQKAFEGVAVHRVFRLLIFLQTRTTIMARQINYLHRQIYGFTSHPSYRVITFRPDDSDSVELAESNLDDLICEQADKMWRISRLAVDNPRFGDPDFESRYSKLMTAIYEGGDPDVWMQWFYISTEPVEPRVYRLTISADDEKYRIPSCNCNNNNCVHCNK